MSRWRRMGQWLNTRSVPPKNWSLIMRAISGGIDGIANARRDRRLTKLERELAELKAQVSRSPRPPKPAHFPADMPPYGGAK